MENQNGGLAYAKQNISKMEMEVNNTKGMHMEPWQNVPETPKSTKGKLIRFLKRNLLLILLLLALIFGVVLGVLLRIYVQPPMDKRAKMYFKFPGDLLMRMLKCLILPLIISSLVAGLAGLDAKASGKMGLRAVVFYMATTFIAVVIGIVLVVSIRPGDRSGQIHESAEATERTSNTADSFLDLIRNMFPNNLVTACFRQTKTLQIPVPLPAGIDNSTMTTTMAANVTQRTPNTAYDFSVTEDDGMNVLGLVVYSVAMGIVISRMGPLGKPLFDFFTAMAEATMKLVIVVIWYSPVGILFLVAAEILDMEDPVRDLEALGLYIGTVMAGLAVHGLIVLPLLYFIFLRKNPFVYLYGVLQALITALGTSSSSATLPVTYRCLEENNKVDKRVTRFVLPVGATINMDGTALYEAVAAIFIAQLRGRSLGVGEIIATSITATAASIGAASVPQAGIITMMIVLTALGLPATDVNKIIAVDWLLDRFRTMINVEGDSIGAGIIYHLSRRELAATDDEDPEEVVVFSNEGATNHIPPRGQIMDNAQL